MSIVLRHFNHRPSLGLKTRNMLLFGLVDPSFSVLFTGYLHLVSF